ncbi:MAG: LytR C-terminal domain-containing protein [Marmoricola sp.]
MFLRWSARPGQRGVVLPAVALVVSICAVVAAAVGYVLTTQPHRASQAAQVTSHRHAAEPTSPAHYHPGRTLRAKPRKPVQRSSVYVVVFNNSNIGGLAGQTAARAQNLGWNVVATDNWYGSIVAPTVYYPPRLHRAAKLLARDLDIARVRPAIQPMQLDRLTVILTNSYTG